MRSKQLPIAKTPIIGLQHLAYPLCIAMNDESCQSWYMNDYVQLEWDENFLSHFTFSNKIMFHNSFFSPCFEINIISKDVLLQNNVDITDFIINSINNNWYFYSTFDEYYVPRRGNYKKYNFKHDFLLYGYNVENAEFNILGFTDKEVFESSSISFFQFTEAFSSNCSGKFEDYDNIVLLRKKDKVKYQFDVDYLILLLSNYVHSSNQFDKISNFYDPTKKRVYGISLYDKLINYFSPQNIEVLSIDIRPLHILWEHKVFMNMRIDFLIEHGYLKNCDSIKSNYKTIEHMAFLTRNLQFKFLVSKDISILRRINSNLEDIKKLELITIELMIEELLKYRH